MKKRLQVAGKGKKVDIDDSSGDTPDIIAKIEEKEKGFLKCCLNCINFRFSGMSYQMSGGRAGYCFYWMGRSGSRVIVDAMSICKKFELCPFTKKTKQGSRESKKHEERIAALRQEYRKMMAAPKKIKIPIS